MPIEKNRPQIPRARKSLWCWFLASGTMLLAEAFKPGVR